MIDADEVQVGGCTSYAVYKSRTTGKKAVVLVNETTDRNLSVSVAFKGGNPGVVRVATPEEPTVKTVTGAIEIPVLSVAVVLEN